MGYLLGEEAERMKLIFALLLVALAPLSKGDPVLHKFELWGNSTKIEKLSLYWGWTNGFIPGKGQAAIEFADCLESMTADQAIAMIDKQYRDHPEKWSRPLGDQFLEALTVAGGPCAGKSPLK